MVVHSYVIKARQRQGGRWSLSREIILGIWTHKKEFAKVQFSNYTTPILKTKLITNKFVKSRLEIIDPKM
jgi:hypothetical protein